MSHSNDALCRDCGGPLPAGLFARGETRIMGAGYCSACVLARTLYCHTCRTPIRPEDLKEGRAVTLLGRRHCENCLGAAVQDGRDRATRESSGVEADRAPSRPASAVTSAAGTEKASSLSDESIAIRREYGRYVPHADATLSVKSGGLRALLGDRVKLWLDVSEGGFRAIISGRFALQDKIAGSIGFRPTKASFRFKAVVVHVQESQRYPGCTLVGCKFESAAAGLQEFIRGKMSDRPTMIPSPSNGDRSRRDSSGSSSTRHPPPRSASA